MQIMQMWNRRVTQIYKLGGQVCLNNHPAAAELIFPSGVHVLGRSTRRVHKYSMIRLCHVVSLVRLSLVGSLNNKHSAKVVNQMIIWLRTIREVDKNDGREL